MSDCYKNTNILQEEDPCNGKKVYTECVIEQSALTILGLPANSTQAEVNQAIQNALFTLEEQTFDQNNMNKFINFTLRETSDENVVAYINGLPTFSVDEFQTLYIKVTTQIRYEVLINDVRTRVYVLKGLGKGLYGTDGTQLEVDDIELISVTGLSISTIESNEDTQFINLGDVGSNDIVTAFNAHTFTGLEDPVQGQDEGYVIINVTIDGDDLQYLFVGDGGEYGTGGGETAILSDFVLLTGVYEAPTEPLQDLQAVTDEGNTTDNDIIINGNTLTLGSATGTTNRFINFNNSAGIIGFDGNTNIFNVTRPFGAIGSTSPNLYVQNNSNFRSSTLYSDNLLFSRDSNNLTLQTPTLTGNHTQTFQDASGTIALLSDISNPTGFESVTESGKTGLRIIGRNASNYGDIGFNAVDGSYNGSASTTHGATGTYSMAFGGIVTSSGAASGAIGYGLLSRSMGEVSVGTYNTDYTPLNTSALVYSTVDRAFTVGIGTALGRHDGLTILRTGSVGINIDNFEAATTGEALQVNGEVKIGAYTLPSTDGTNGQILQTDGSGNVTWQDSSGGGSYIPLSGTEVGSPVTGNIEIGTDVFDIIYNDSPSYSRFFIDGATTGIEVYDGTYTSSINVSSDTGVGIIAPNTSKGITSNIYYGANYDDNTYVQKKYVDDSISTISGVTLKYSETFGNGSDTTITITHSLGISDLSSILVREVSSGEIVYPTMIVADTNTVELTFSTAPTTNQYRVTVTA